MYGCESSDVDCQLGTAAFGGATAIDNCDNSVTLSFVAGTAIDQCGNTSTTPYTLTATDDCGNCVTRYANLIITDETAPVFNAPTATNTVACSGTVNASPKQTWLNSATGTDACGGNVTTTYALINEVTSCVGTTTTDYAILLIHGK
jgi:hypothetical protein